MELDTTDETSPSNLRRLPLAAIRDHPRNPRLVLRQDVIDGIAANLEAQGGYPHKHAIHVRPVEGGYETLAGHHRRHAATQAGLTEIWAWVEDLDDAAAYMELALSNNQGELSPLEIGLHALYAVPLGAKGRGHEGGLREYARLVGKHHGNLVQYRQGAEVLMATRENGLLVDHFLDKAMHLAAIHAAPRATWPALVAYLARNPGLSAEKMGEVVQSVRRFTIPAEHEHWLPLRGLAHAFLTAGHPTPHMVAQLIDEADAIIALLATHDMDGATFRALCHEQCRLQSWDRRALTLYRHQVELAILEAEGKLPEGVTLYQQDFRTLELPPESVDLILTDPPYDTESGELYEALAQRAVQWLKPGGSLLVYSGQGRLGPILTALGTHLRYWWTLALLHQGATQIMPIQEIAVGWKPIAWLSKGEPRYRLRSDIVAGAGREKGEHPWQQAAAESRPLIAQLCPEGGVVLDPMMGSGSTLLAALAEGRRVIGCERDPETFVVAEQRIRGERDAA